MVVHSVGETLKGQLFIQSVIELRGYQISYPRELVHETPHTKVSGRLRKGDAICIRKSEHR